MDLFHMIQSGLFVSADDGVVVNHLNAAFSPEIARLKSASPTLEATTTVPAAAIPGTIDGSHSPSTFLFGQEYAEVNRSIVSCLAVKWLLGGDYEAFTQAQAPRNLLSRITFGELSAACVAATQTPEDVFDLLVSMIVSDVGKDASLADDLREQSVEISPHADHDEVVYEAAIHDCVPALRALPQSRRNDVILGLQFAKAVNVPQLIQAECPPSTLLGALILKGKPRAFALKYLEVLLDVAGAGAHEDARGAARMTQPVAATLLNAHHALKDLLDQKASVHSCYDSILLHRGQILQSNGVKALSASDQSERALLRLLAMGRVEDRDTADDFEQAFQGLSSPTHERLIHSLNIDGCDGGGEVAVIPYYMPGLMAIALSNLPLPLQDGSRVKTLQSLFRFLTRILSKPSKESNGHGSVIVRNVSFARELVKSPAFRQDPRVLDDLDI